MGGKKKKILLVEDEAILLNTLADGLSEEGFDVDKARSGEEGLEKAINTHPDLIILDILMPNMGGIEMAKELRKDEWGKDAKVIILSNIASMEKVQQALESNIFEYLKKSDFSIEAIVNHIKKVIELE